MEETKYCSLDTVIDYESIWIRSSQQTKNFINCDHKPSISKIKENKEFSIGLATIDGKIKTLRISPILHTQFLFQPESFIQTRKRQTTLDLISYIGGIANFIFIVGKLLCYLIGRRAFRQQLLKVVYGFDFNQHSKKTLKKAKNKLKNDLDISKLLQTVYKIKATLKVLMSEGDQEVVKKIKSVFRNDMRISKHPTENEFDFFLEYGSLQSEINKHRNDRLKRNAFDGLKRRALPKETEPPLADTIDKAQQK